MKSLSSFVLALIMSFQSSIVYAQDMGKMDEAIKLSDSELLELISQKEIEIGQARDKIIKVHQEIDHAVSNNKTLKFIKISGYLVALTGVVTSVMAFKKYKSVSPKGVLPFISTYKYPIISLVLYIASIYGYSYAYLSDSQIKQLEDELCEIEEMIEGIERDIEKAKQELCGRGSC